MRCGSGCRTNGERARGEHTLDPAPGSASRIRAGAASEAGRPRPVGSTLARCTRHSRSVSSKLAPALSNQRAVRAASSPPAQWSRAAAIAASNPAGHRSARRRSRRAADYAARSKPDAASRDSEKRPRTGGAARPTARSARPESSAARNRTTAGEWKFSA